MAQTYSVNCPKCGIELKITEKLSDTTGEEKQQTVHCPACFGVIGEYSSAGTFDVDII